MDIQQQEKEYLAAYIYHFKQEASRCKFDNDATTIRIFIKGLKNAHRWSLELAKYNLSLEWISGAKNKAADCLSRLVKPITTPINMLTTSSTDRPAFHTRSHTQNTSSHTTSTPHPDTAPQISQEPTTAPKQLTADHLETLLQMQKADPFCKCISKRLLNGKAPHHEFDTFTHVNGLLYKHVMDTGKKFLALAIPNSWKYTVLMEAHDKLGHQVNSCTYCLIKCQYYWKRMNKDIRKYIANCVLC